MKNSKKGIRLLYMIVFLDLNNTSWIETTSELIVFDRLKAHRNFYSGIIYKRKDTLKAFLRANEILKEKKKDVIIDMSKEG